MGSALTPSLEVRFLTDNIGIAGLFIPTPVSYLNPPDIIIPI
jgi:hypothetical protein